MKRQDLNNLNKITFWVNQYVHVPESPDYHKRKNHCSGQIREALAELGVAHD